jgi:hypothetical protein
MHFYTPMLGFGASLTIIVQGSVSFTSGNIDNTARFNVINVGSVSISKFQFL